MPHANNVSTVLVSGRHAVALSAGQMHTCALHSGLVVCWGSTIRGATGQGPPAAIGSIAAGTEFTCGIAGTTTYCWGDDARGELGDRTVITGATPRVVSGGIAFTNVAAGNGFACGLDGGGRAYCWGANSLGQLGDRSVRDRLAPSTNTPLPGAPRFASIAAGAFHACALTAAGVAYCWGGNADGALGRGNTTSSADPMPVVASSMFASLALGNGFTCGITAQGQVQCWGANHVGALGDGSTHNRSTPSPIAAGAERFAAVAAGAYHACALTAAGAVYCWGDNSRGQIGNGTRIDAPTPTRVAAPAPFIAISAGFAHTCALTGDSTVYCWGDNTLGQVGGTGAAPRPTPTAVSLP